MKENQNFKILTIDGGGIKGLYSAALLAGFEKRFNKRIADCFDLIAGTSTGGILALALAARIPAYKIVKFYEDWGPKIFHPRINSLYGIRSLIFSKYPEKVLKEALISVFNKLRVKDIYDKEKPLALCIPSINAITGVPVVFKTLHHEDLKLDDDLFLWQVALATSSAPIYFPITRIESPERKSSYLYVDGGLWANNPSSVALVEALTYMGVKKLENIYLLSVGNIMSKTCFNSNTLKSKGLLLWGKKIISMTLDTQSRAIHNQIELLFRTQNISDNYIRIEESIEGTHKSLKSLDCASKTNINDLILHGTDRSNIVGVRKEIKKFFI